MAPLGLEKRFSLTENLNDKETATVGPSLKIQKG